RADTAPLTAVSGVAARELHGRRGSVTDRKTEGKSPRVERRPDGPQSAAAFRIALKAHELVLTEQLDVVVELEDHAGTGLEVRTAAVGERGWPRLLENRIAVDILAGAGRDVGLEARLLGVRVRA